jgi:hypothetical protein
MTKDLLQSGIAGTPDAALSAEAPSLQAIPSSYAKAKKSGSGRPRKADSYAAPRVLRIPALPPLPGPPASLALLKSADPVALRLQHTAEDEAVFHLSLMTLLPGRLDVSVITLCQIYRFAELVSLPLITVSCQHCADVSPQRIYVKRQVTFSERSSTCSQDQRSHNCSSR